MTVLIEREQPVGGGGPDKTAAPAMTMPIRKKRVMTGMNSQ